MEGRLRKELELIRAKCEVQEGDNGNVVVLTAKLTLLPLERLRADILDKILEVMPGLRSTRSAIKSPLRVNMKRSWPTVRASSDPFCPTTRALHFAEKLQHHELRTNA